ncbi:hypothetical protein BS78_07G212100 [Paspalum vaginatum]|nr:hypothetical protein BS78_07G212100 [Paspalum vaginatum]
MDDPVAATTLEKIVKTGLKIKDAVLTARHNQEACQEIGRRVLRCSSILSQMQQAGMMDDASSPAATSGAVEGLQGTLERALQLVASCQERSIQHFFFIV